MSFATVLDSMAVEQSASVRAFARRLETQDDLALDHFAARAHELTRQYFGRTMRLFAPIYLSNECINSCRYCGFSRENPILRVTLKVEEVLKEAQYLAREGFRHILLVAGEHPRFISREYLADCVRALQKEFSSISLEVGPLETGDYRPLVEAGAEGLIVYQETYDREVYAEMHRSGPKRDFDWRLECPERAYDAGFKRIGIGALFGLTPWRQDALALAVHTEYLLKRCWKASLTVSLPRLRPAAGEFRPVSPMSDRELVQLVCAFRVTFPQVGIVLSTRESGPLRDLLTKLGVTMMSAGSHTEPGGYTGQGAANLHRTVRGRIMPPQEPIAAEAGAAAQFETSDSRSPEEIARVLRGRGLEPVWKDWDAALTR